MTPNNNRFLWSDEQAIKTLKTALENDTVAITTTDTIPGFLAPLTEKGLSALNHLKGDRQAKPYLILVANPKKLTHFVDPNNVTPNIEALVKHCWPGPLTLVFKAKKDLPAYLKSSNGTIAIRCPKHRGLQSLLLHFNGLFSTSANVSRAKAPITLNDIDTALVNSVACVMQDDAVSMTHQPSTILDVSSLRTNEDGHVKLIRAGEMPLDFAEAIIHHKTVR